MARITDKDEAERLARTANAFGSWDAYLRSFPIGRWVQNASGRWISRDPVVAAAKARDAKRKAAEEAAQT